MKVLPFALFLFFAARCASSPESVAIEITPEIEKASGYSRAQIVGASENAKQLTLEDAYKLALSNTERLAAKNEDLQQAEAQKQQTWGAFLPRASFNTAQPLFAPAGFNSPLLYLRVRLNVMTGFTEYSAWKSANTAIKRGRHQLHHDAGRLLLEIADVFYALEMQKKLYEIKMKSVQLTEERMGYLRRRRSLGRSTASEILTAETQLSRLKAEAEALNLSMKNSATSFQLMTGVKSNTIALQIKNYDIVKTLDDDIRKVAEEREDVKAAIASVKIEEDGLQQAYGEFFPNVYVQGDTYIDKPSGRNVVTAGGLSSQANYNIQLVAEFPIFSGMQTYHKIKEYKSRVKKAKYSANYTIRLAKNEIEQAYQSYVSTRKEMEAYEISLEIAKRNYLAIKREYGLRRVTNLEVLTALIEQQTLEALHTSAYFRHLSSGVWLAVSINKKPAEILG